MVARRSKCGGSISLHLKKTARTKMAQLGNARLTVTTMTAIKNRTTAAKTKARSESARRGKREPRRHRTCKASTLVVSIDHAPKLIIHMGGCIAYIAKIPQLQKSVPHERMKNSQVLLHCFHTEQVFVVCRCNALESGLTGLSCDYGRQSPTGHICVYALYPFIRSSCP